MYLIKLLLFPSDRFNDADDDLSYMETSYRQIEREEQKRLEKLRRLRTPHTEFF